LTQHGTKKHVRTYDAFLQQRGGEFRVSADKRSERVGSCILQAGAAAGKPFAVYTGQDR
jgi:hypothetical protein